MGVPAGILQNTSTSTESFAGIVKLSDDSAKDMEEDGSSPAEKVTSEEQQGIDLRLKQDNQLRSALNILKSLNLYTEYRTSSDLESGQQKQP